MGGARSQHGHERLAGQVWGFHGHGREGGGGGGGGRRQPGGRGGATEQEQRRADRGQRDQIGVGHRDRGLGHSSRTVRQGVAHQQGLHFN